MAEGDEDDVRDATKELLNLKTRQDFSLACGSVGVMKEGDGYAEGTPLFVVYECT